VRVEMTCREQISNWCSVVKFREFFRSNDRVIGVLFIRGSLVVLH
jgi:hypothetical protein